MSNAVSRHDLNETLALHLARTGPTGSANSNLIQQKFDKKGEIVTEGDSSTRKISAHDNYLDDFVLEWYRTGGGGVVPQTPASIQTTDATPTVVDTVTLSQDKVTRTSFRVVGRETGQEDNAVYAEFTHRWIDDAGTSAQWDVESGTPSDYSPAATLTTAAVAVTLVGSVVTVTATGELATNIDWTVKRVVEEFF
jgi:hypothetical protein